MQTEMEREFSVERKVSDFKPWRIGAAAAYRADMPPSQICVTLRLCALARDPIPSILQILIILSKKRDRIFGILWMNGIERRGRGHGALNQSRATPGAKSRAQKTNCKTRVCEWISPTPPASTTPCTRPQRDWFCPAALCAAVPCALERGFLPRAKARRHEGRAGVFLGRQEGRKG